MIVADLPDAVLATAFQQVALLLLQGAGGDINAALEAARDTLCAFEAATEDEFRLAIRIVSCNLQASHALAQAADSRKPMNVVLRLRSLGIGLSREADKAERRLEKLRNARQKAQQTVAEPPAPEPEAPPMEPTKPARQADPIKPNHPKKPEVQPAEKTPSPVHAQASSPSWIEVKQQQLEDQRLAAHLFLSQQIQTTPLASSS